MTAKIIQKNITNVATTILPLPPPFNQMPCNVYANQLEPQVIFPLNKASNKAQPKLPNHWDLLYATRKKLRRYPTAM